MAAELGAAQGDLSASLIELRSTPNADLALVAQGDQQLAAILAIKHKLATAGPVAMGALSAEVANIVASASAVARLTQAASVGASSEGAMSLAAADRAARAAVADFEDDYFKKRKFDPYLEFASEEDEREFRKREAERRQAIDAARAEGTTAGDLRALRLAKEQMADAGAHGADRSPDFAPMKQRLDQAEQDLVAAKDAATPPKEEPSQRDPLDDIAPSTSVSPAIIANLRAAGVTIPASDAEGHGLQVTAAAPNANRSRNA